MSAANPTQYYGILLVCTAFQIQSQVSTPKVESAPASVEYRWLANEKLVGFDQILTEKKWIKLDQFKSEIFQRYEFGSEEEKNDQWFQHFEMRQVVIPEEKELERTPITLYMLGIQIANRRCVEKSIVGVLSRPEKEESPMFFTVTCKSKKGDMIEKSYYRVVPGKKTIFIVGIFQRLPLITDAEIKEWKVKFDKLKIVTIAPSSSPTPQTPLPTPEAQKPASPQ